MTSGANQPVLITYPVRFGNRPFLWTMLMITVPIGIGLIGFLVWRLLQRTHKLIVTEDYVMTQEGLFDIKQVQVFHGDISRLNINQRLWQRVLNIGDIEIGSSATDAIDMTMCGIPEPKELRRLINRLRRQQKGIKSQ